MKKLLKKLLGPLIIALVTLACTELAHYSIALHQKPVLNKQTIYTDLGQLAPDVRKQIALVPTSYTLQNLSPSAAKDVTIFIRGEQLLSASSITFSPSSEEHQLTIQDMQSIRVNVPKIRPNGDISFQILASAANLIKFNELSDDAVIVTLGDIQAAKEQREKAFWVWLISAFVVIIYVPVVGSLIYFFNQAAKGLRLVETNEAFVDIRIPLISFLLGLYIYNNLILGSLSVLQPFIPLPHINFEELFYIFILYFTITRYKLIQEWLMSTIAKNNSQKPVEKIDSPK